MVATGTDMDEVKKPLHPEHEPAVKFDRADSQNGDAHISDLQLADQRIAENQVSGVDDSDDEEDEEGNNCCVNLREMDCSCHRCKQFMQKTFTLQNARKKFPITEWLPKYSLYFFQCDVIAGLTVGLMVLPQGLAYAQVAELPQQYGLYSAFLGCFVYCFMGTAKDITLGPTAVMSLMTAAFAASPVTGDATYAIVLCLMTGIIQTLMGIFHLGFLVRFISHPVISGFTSAAAITIAIGQIKYLLGLKNISREFLHMVYDLCKHIPETNYWDTIMGGFCMVILICMKMMRDWNCYGPEENRSRCMRALKYSVWLLSISRNALIVILSAVVVYALSLHDIHVFTITGHLQPGLPPIALPAFSVMDHANGTGNGTLYTAGDIFEHIGTGFAIVPLLGLVESIAIGKAFARKNNYRIRPSQELLAIGVANILGSFIGSYPVTGSFSRTAVNSQSGVKTPLGGIFTGALVMLALAFLTPWFTYIPKAALGAVIITAVIQMIDLKILKSLWQMKKLDILPWGFTFLFSFLLGIEYGILIGIAVNQMMLLYAHARPGTTVVSREIVVIKFDIGLHFPAIEYVSAKLNRNALRMDPPKSVILDCTHWSGLDYTTIHGFHEILEDFKRLEVTLVFANLKTKLLETLLNAGLPNFKHAGSVEEAWGMIDVTDGEGVTHSLLGSQRSLHTVGKPAHGSINYDQPNSDEEIC